MRQIIGRPSKEPSDVLVRAFRARCVLHPEVERAFMFQTMLVDPTNPPSLAVGIFVDDDVPPPQARQLLDDLGRVPHELGLQQELVLQILTADALADVARVVAPFYERGSVEGQPPGAT
jgi:SseB protein C-terminal domain